MADNVAAKAGPPVVTISNIVTNPDVRDLSEACRQYGASLDKPEIIVALEGGSIIDAAKVVAASQGDFTRVMRHLTEGLPLDTVGLPPIVATPSTAGTGSEVTSWARVWDQERGRRSGALFPPCVADRVSPSSELVREETFGPVIPIIRCPDDIEQVIRISNSTAYGLSSGICTNNLEYATRFIAGLPDRDVALRRHQGFRLVTRRVSLRR
jgi:hypothetical protein